MSLRPATTNVYVFVSPSGGPTEKNPKKNPLSPNQKVDLLQHQYPDLPIHFVNMGEAKEKGARPGPGGAVMFLKKCYKNGVMLVGGDRIGAFDWLGKDFLKVEGISRPQGAMSATIVRKAATAAQQTRQQTETFRSAIQFGAVTPEHANEIKRMIRAAKIKSRIKMPVSGEIISDYGEGKDQHKLKNGLVFKVKEDSFVTSPMDGTVVYANKFKSFGNLVMIKDNRGFTSVLIGMRSLLISTGNEVLAGEPIAKISSTLQSQLYFELRENGKIVDPKSKVEIL